MKLWFIRLLVLFLLCAIRFSFPQWKTALDEENNNCTALSTQQISSIVSDGNRGDLITCEDEAGILLKQKE